MGDPISKLPMDTSENTADELRVLGAINVPREGAARSVTEPVHENPGHRQGSAWSETVSLIVVAVLFAVLASDIAGRLIERILPSAADKWYVQLAIRTILFTALYFLLKTVAVIKP